MFVHFFQIVTKFLYVCQYVSWLTFLLKLDKYKDISCSGWDIFLNLFVEIPGMFIHYFQIVSNSCMSDRLLVGFFLTEIRLIYVYLLFWMRYLSEYVWRHSFHVCSLVQNIYEILVCLSFCLLAHILKEIMITFFFSSFS